MSKSPICTSSPCDMAGDEHHDVAEVEWPELLLKPPAEVEAFDLTKTLDASLLTHTIPQREANDKIPNFQP